MSDYHGLIETLHAMNMNQKGSKKRHPRGVTTSGFDRIAKIKERIKQRKEKKEING